MSLSRYADYKAATAADLPAIPAHWEIRRIKQIGLLSGGAGFPHEEQGFGGEELAFYKVSALGQAGSDGVLPRCENTISRTTAARLGAVVFPPGTLVFAKVGAALLLGRIRVLGEAACIDNNMMGLIADETVACAAFLRYAMQRINFSLIANPGAVPSVSEAQIGSIAIPLPSLQEQHAVVAFLDRETAKLDALVAEQKRLISLLREKLNVLISDAVTYGMKIHASRIGSGVEWLRTTPADWPIISLGRAVRESPCYGVLVPDYSVDGVPMLRITDMEYGRADIGSLTTISHELSAQYARTVVAENDVVLSVVGTIGKAMRITAEFAGVNLSRAVARIQPNERMVPEYLVWLFRSSVFTNYVDLVATGTAQRVLNMADLVRFRFPCPTIAKQVQIVAYLDEASARFESLIAEATRAVTLLLERRAALIASSVTGQIDVRCCRPGVEPVPA